MRLGVFLQTQVTAGSNSYCIWRPVRKEFLDLLCCLARINLFQEFIVFLCPEIEFMLLRFLVSLTHELLPSQMNYLLRLANRLSRTIARDWGVSKGDGR